MPVRQANQQRRSKACPSATSYEALMVAGREQPGYFGQKGRAVIRARDQRAGQFASRPGAILRAFESAELGPSIRCRRRGGCVVAPAIAVCIRTRTSCLS